MQLAMKTFAIDEKSVSGYIVSFFFWLCRLVTLILFSTINFWVMSLSHRSYALPCQRGGI
jgi:hypothetical protein